MASASGGALGALCASRRDDWIAGARQGVLLACAILVMVLPPSRTTPPMARTAAAVSYTDGVLLSAPDFGDATASDDVRQMASWVLARQDHGQRPFVIIDKKQAQVFVFGANGRLLGDTPVLLGHAPGDDSVAGIGKRPIEQVQPHERTTPAGRFVAERGRNTLDEDIVWVDYDAAVSMHRVRLTDPKERRLERLASATASDNRISFGCINMPPAFFDQVLWPAMQGPGRVVYVLPELKTLAEVFPAVV